jgi:hypothetical protein
MEKKEIGKNLTKQASKQGNQPNKQKRIHKHFYPLMKFQKLGSPRKIT